LLRQDAVAAVDEEIYQQALEAIKREAQKVLEEQVKKVEEAGGSVKEAHLRVGERRDQAIVHLAEELGSSREINTRCAMLWTVVVC
jgi:nucleotide-binding universal stress UspA family protein